MDNCPPQSPDDANAPSNGSACAAPGLAMAKGQEPCQLTGLVLRSKEVSSPPFLLSLFVLSQWDGWTENLADSVSLDRQDDRALRCHAGSMHALQNILRRRSPTALGKTRSPIFADQSDAPMQSHQLPRHGIFCRRDQFGRADVDASGRRRRSFRAPRIDAARHRAAGTTGWQRDAVVSSVIGASIRITASIPLSGTTAAGTSAVALDADLHQNRPKKHAGEEWGQARRSGSA